MGRLWSCNFISQLANALIIEGDYNGSVLALEQGLAFAMEMFYPELQVCLKWNDDFYLSNIILGPKDDISGGGQNPCL